MTNDEPNALLRPVQPGGDWRNTVIIGGGWEDDGTLASGFLDAADILVEHWKAHRPDDGLVLPILANYRHGIELALKDMIREAASCLRRDGFGEPDLQRASLDDRLSRTHSIGNLVEVLNGYLGRLQLGLENRLPADTQEVLDSLHALDASGQTLRYSTVKTGSGKQRKLAPARPDQQHFDLAALAAVLHDAGTLVLHGVSGVLGEYEEWQRYMRAEGGKY